MPSTSSCRKPDVAVEDTILELRAALKEALDSWDCYQRVLWKELGGEAHGGRFIPDPRSVELRKLA